MSDTQTPQTVIERTFDAPIEMVWKMWTEAEHFGSWYGPMGAKIPTAEMDVQVGGKRLICMAMETPNGPMEMWFTGSYTEVDPTTRLAYTDSLCDADGNVLGPEAMGMPAGHKMETQVVVELSGADGGTKMVMTHVGVPEDSPGAGGWHMAFDKLEAQLAA